MKSTTNPTEYEFTENEFIATFAKSRFINPSHNQSLPSEIVNVISFIIAAIPLLVVSLLTIIFGINTALQSLSLLPVYFVLMIALAVCLGIWKARAERKLQSGD